MRRNQKTCLVQWIQAPHQKKWIQVIMELIVFAKIVVLKRSGKEVFSRTLRFLNWLFLRITCQKVPEARLPQEHIQSQ